MRKKLCQLGGLYHLERLYEEKEEIAWSDDVSATRYIAFYKQIFRLVDILPVSYKQVGDIALEGGKADISFSRVLSAGQYIALHINTP